MGDPSAAVTRAEAAASENLAEDMLKGMVPKGHGVPDPRLVRPDIADGLGGDLKLRR